MTSLVKPIMAFMGVRSSWDILARNTDLAWVAASAVSCLVQFCLHPFALRDVAQHTGEKFLSPASSRKRDFRNSGHL